MGKKTEDIPKNDRSKRFLEAINKIQEHKKISDSQLSREISGNDNNKDLVNKIRKGVTEPQYEHIEVFSALYNVNKEFILNNAHEMFITEKRSPSQLLDMIPDVLDLQKKIESLLVEINKEQGKRIADKDKIIELQSEIDRLKDKYERKQG